MEDKHLVSILKEQRKFACRASKAGNVMHNEWLHITQDVQDTLI